MITKTVVRDDYVVITEDGKDYICDNNPGVMGGELLVAEFHPRGNYRKTLLVECFEDEETWTRTYKPFASERDEKRAWEIYTDVLHIGELLLHSVCDHPSQALNLCPNVRKASGI